MSIGRREFLKNLGQHFLTCRVREVRTVRELTVALSLIAPRSERWIAERSTTIFSRTVLTMLTDSGVHPKVAQKLVRHSTNTLTMDRYAHARTADMNAAVENLPSLTFAKQPGWCRVWLRPRVLR